MKLQGRRICYVSRQSGDSQILDELEQERKGKPVNEDYSFTSSH